MGHIGPIAMMLLWTLEAPPHQYEPKLYLHAAIESAPGVRSVLADRPTVTDFERLCDYLGAESGAWLQANPNRDSAAPTAPDSFDLTFVCDDARRVLTMEIGSHYRDGTRRVGWRAVWFWHPGRKEIVYLAYARGNIIEGVTEFTKDDVFVTTYVRYARDGTETRGRDENTILSPRQHRVAAYSFEDGEWHLNTSGLWRLQPQEAGRGREVSPAVMDYLTSLLGRWEARTTLYDAWGNVERELVGGFTEEKLVENHLNLHTSHLPDSRVNKAFRFVNPMENKAYLIDVTADGNWWVVSGNVGDSVQQSLERELADGRRVILRFTHANVRDGSFEALMHRSFDGGEAWQLRSHTYYRRVRN